jgi:hypothetical protein
MSCGVPTYATFSKLEKLAVSEDFNLPEGDWQHRNPLRQNIRPPIVKVCGRRNRAQNAVESRPKSGGLEYPCWPSSGVSRGWN